MSGKSSRPWWWGAEEKVLQRVMLEGLIPCALEARQLMDEVRDLHPRLREAFVRWVNTGELDEAFEVHGYSASRIRTLKPEFIAIGIFGAWDRLLRDPDDAKQLLHWPREWWQGPVPDPMKTAH